MAHPGLFIVPGTAPAGPTAAPLEDAFRAPLQDPFRAVLRAAFWAPLQQVRLQQAPLQAAKAPR
jgi:hypothetical protein